MNYFETVAGHELCELAKTALREYIKKCRSEQYTRVFDDARDAIRFISYEADQGSELVDFISNPNASRCVVIMKRKKDSF